ncbi:MAG: hypothetical protein ACT443_14760, partial [Gemmatimonadota bacterium]
MHMLPEEAILRRSDGDALILTTHRIRHRAKTWGADQVVSILFDRVASAGLVYSSHPMLLVLAALLGLAAVFSESMRAAGFLGAILLAIIYLSTRRHVLEIASAGHRIRVRISGMSTEA